MTALIGNMLLALIWALMTGRFDLPNIVFGFLIGLVVMGLAEVSLGKTGYAARVVRVLSLTAFFMKELVRANIRMAQYTLSPLGSLKPAVLAVPLDPRATDLEITLLANMVTLTPGTLSLDVSECRTVLFVHFMHVEDRDEAIREIKDGFENRLLRVTR